MTGFAAIDNCCVLTIVGDGRARNKSLCLGLRINAIDDFVVPGNLATTKAIITREA